MPRSRGAVLRVRNTNTAPEKDTKLSIRNCSCRMQLASVERAKLLAVRTNSCRASSNYRNNLWDSEFMPTTISQRNNIAGRYYKCLITSAAVGVVFIVLCSCNKSTQYTQIFRNFSKSECVIACSIKNFR